MDIAPVLASLNLPVPAGPGAPSLPAALAAGGPLEATLAGLLPDGLLLRFADGRTLQAQGSLPFPVGSQLLLKALPLPAGVGLRLQVLQATPPPAPPILAPLFQGEAAQLLVRLSREGQLAPLASLMAALAKTGPGAAEQPEAWSRWLREVLNTLVDAARSPAEATFHALQAKEGTGWFEVPLPWAPGTAPLRLWVESDAPGDAPGEDPVHRVLLSVPFTTLGEVRVGLEHQRAGLRVRIWLADPTRLAPQADELQAELATLGQPVTLQVLALPTGSPELSALAAARPLQALG